MSSRRMSLNVRSIAAVLLIAATISAQGAPEVLYYKFDEGSGNTTANLAIPSQGAASPTISGHQLSSFGGLSGGSLLGVTQGSGLNRVNTGWIPNLGTGPWTIGFWINLNGNVGSSTADLMYVMGEPSTSWRIFINSSAGGGNVRMRGPLTEITSAGAPLSSGGHYVHFVFNGSNALLLYIDGVLNASVAQAPGSVNVTGTSQLQVGGYDGGASPESLKSGVNFDEFRLYDRALTGTEIQATWNIPLNPMGVVANFTASSTSGGTPLTVNFTDLSTTTEPGGVTSWMWDFGDGNTSTAQNPSHTYTVPGIYTVSLTAGDGVNTPATQTRPDYITAGPYAFDVQTTGGGVGDIVITAAPPPAGTTEGYTLFSASPATVLGQGNFFGINFDDTVVMSLTSPAFLNNPLHWLPSPAHYPAVPFSLPAGSLVQYAGVTADALCLYIVNGQIVTSAVDRVTF